MITIRIKGKYASDNTNRLPNSCISLNLKRNENFEHNVFQDYEANITSKWKYKTWWCRSEEIIPRKNENLHNNQFKL